jgi:tetratricopeptide (TPR) repeat protein
LPHDRTREQRQREGGEFSLLSVRGAFLPALFAVLMMGFQLHFWRSATATTGEMLDVLVFAFLIFCLLKFRISQSDNWLFIFAFVYGLGTTNNWALIGFFPLFLAVMVWIKGVNFFNARFLVRIAGYGILGLLLYLLIPAIASLGSERANFWSVLHLELGSQSFGLHMVPRWIVAVAALPTLLPLLFAGIKWPSFEGELSATGNTLTRLMFRLLHVVFLLLALVLFFDFKYSPSVGLAEAPIGFLTFYYIGALCIGYFSGYVLLVYGKDAAQGWDKRGPINSAVSYLFTGLLWLLAVAAPGWLFYKSVVHINAGRSSALADYSAEMIRDLPAKPLIILSDDPTRLYLLDAAFKRAGKPNNNIMIETGSLPYREYISYLVSRYPELKKSTPDPALLPHVMGAELVIKYLYSLSLKYSIYYLQPSFGYYFEIFYLKPHGLVYELQTYPKQMVEQPLPSPQEIQENQGIWGTLDKTVLPGLPARAKLDPDTATLAINYSVAMDMWGVTLQKAGYLPEAKAQFTEAAKVDPQNFIAKINLEYNTRMQKKDYRPINVEDLLYKALVAYHGLINVLKFNGPADEPSVNLEFGQLMAEGHDFRQAAILFDRRLQLLPGDVSAELDLAKT